MDFLRLVREAKIMDGVVLVLTIAVAFTGDSFGTNFHKQGPNCDSNWISSRYFIGFKLRELSITLSLKSVTVIIGQNNTVHGQTTIRLRTRLHQRQYRRGSFLQFWYLEHSQLCLPVHRAKSIPTTSARSRWMHGWVTVENP